MTYRLITRSGVALAVLAALIMGGQAPIAQAGTGLTIQPIKISQTMKPGSSVSGTILLSNASTEDVVVDVSIQDFIPTAGTETFQFVGRAPGVTTVRDWITVNGPHQFTFKQGESRQMEYTINAPQDAEPGSHFGVFFFKATNVSDAESQIKVGTQVGVLTFVTIPGKFEQKGDIKNFWTDTFVQKGPVNFNLDFENTGTVHFEPKGMIDITNIFGTKVGSVPIEGYAVLPTGIKKLNFSWNVVGLLLGKYKAVASVYATDGTLLSSASTSFYAMPVWYIVGFVVTVLFLFFLIRFIKSRLKFSISLKK
ncbi:MAG: hypothetical protein RLY66_571 [Candidatus Parcubacteria bacterium]|jgi:hypothetical protein